MVEQRRHFPGDPRLISDMRDFIRNAVGQEWNEADDHQVISQLELAVSEAASNILLHGLQGHPGESIELILEVAGDQVFVTFLYQGCAFTPPTVPTPDFAHCAESGYGLYLIQQSVDEVQFSRDDAGLCRIHFVKNRKQRFTGVVPNGRCD